MRIDLLFGNRILFQKLTVALQVDFGVLKEGGIAHQLAFGLQQGGLVRTGVEFGQKLAFFHNLAFLEVYFHQLAVHAAP